MNQHDVNQPEPIWEDSCILASLRPSADLDWPLSGNHGDHADSVTGLRTRSTIISLENWAEQTNAGYLYDLQPAEVQPQSRPGGMDVWQCKWQHAAQQDLWRRWGSRRREEQPREAGGRQLATRFIVKDLKQRRGFTTVLWKMEGNWCFTQYRHVRSSTTSGMMSSNTGPEQTTRMLLSPTLTYTTRI